MAGCVVLSDAHFDVKSSHSPQPFATLVKTSPPAAVRTSETCGSIWGLFTSLAFLIAHLAETHLNHSQTRCSSVHLMNSKMPCFFFSSLTFFMLNSREVGAHPALRLNNTHFPLLNEKVGNQVVRRQKGHTALTNRARTAVPTWHLFFNGNNTVWSTGQTRRATAL